MEAQIDFELWERWVDKLLHEPAQRAMYIEDLPGYGEEGFLSALYGFMVMGFATVDLFKGVQLTPEAVCLFMEHLLRKPFCNFREQSKHILDGLRTQGVDSSVSGFFQKRSEGGRFVGLSESFSKYKDNLF